MDTFLTIASKRDWRNYATTPIPGELVERILDAGRLAGSARNLQPWTFVVVESAEARERLAATVYVRENVERATLIVAVVSRSAFDAGRATQNMLLAAWNEGIVSCPNGMPDPAATAEALGLEEPPVIVLTFGYPARPLDPEAKPAAAWSAEAKRKPLAEVVRRA